MLLNDISCEIHELTSHLIWEIIHIRNLKVLDECEFLFAELKHTFFKTCLKTFKVIEMQLFVASLRRVFLKNCGQELV